MNLSKNRHGMSRTRTYQCWESMKARCNGSDKLGIEYYQSKGITYDPRWEDFREFFKDMGICPENYTLDRIDSDGNYSKENCRWTTRSEQSFNTKKQRNNTSGKTGVCWSKKENRWIARIDFQGKPIRLGAFKEKEEAIKVRNEAEIYYFGYNKD